MGTDDDRRKNITDGKIFSEGNQAKQLAPNVSLPPPNLRCPGVFLSLPTETRLSGCQAPN